MNIHRKSKVISIEGGEGSGKTTAMARLTQWLNEKGIDHMTTREPGGVRIAEAIREIILHVDHTEMDSRTEALLYAAARRQHLTQKVLPALDKGQWVIFDRYVDSSVVYQGYVRGIGMKEVYEMNRFATEDFLPDLTIYLDIDPEMGLQRVMSGEGREVNRLDLEGLAFHNKVREGYHLLLEENPERMVLVDASGTPEEVFENICTIVNRFL